MNCGMRDPKAVPAASEHLESPYEPEARFATKRGMHWTGYKVHLTETCDEDLPHLVTQVTTTIAPATDVAQVLPIQEALAQRDLLPREQFVDAGYVRACNVIQSRRKYQVDLVGPTTNGRRASKGALSPNASRSIGTTAAPSARAADRASAGAARRRAVRAPSSTSSLIRRTVCPAPTASAAPAPKAVAALAASPCRRVRSMRCSWRDARDSRRPRSPISMRTVPASRAPSRKECEPSAYDERATAGSAKHTYSRSRLLLPWIYHV